MDLPLVCEWTNRKAETEYALKLDYGIGKGEGGELHGQWGNTITIYSINLFDLWDSIYEKNKPK